jgi:Camelysin metallo-endopeptidase
MQESRTSSHLRLMATSVFAGSVILVAGSSVFAGLNATVSASQEDSTGTLVLSSANNGSGFTQPISNLAPGDVVNRYVTLTNSGTLNSRELSLSVASTGTSTLITDGVAPATSKALTVTVLSCTGGNWDTNTGACSGTINTEIAETSLSAFTAQKVFAVSSTLSSGSNAKLQIKTRLPNQDETTINGVLPPVTVQNGSATLTYLFNQAQLPGAVTNS